MMINRKSPIILAAIVLALASSAIEAQTAKKSVRDANASASSDDPRTRCIQQAVKSNPGRDVEGNAIMSARIESYVNCAKQNGFNP